ncbi:uncharacterized protein LOC143718545 [Siphateles boraxobius]|uniref:uncharacterized protein LOC143718545 n=1 Tax=Siphateles boraxobius TaxID=180520 RepID=UPI0040634AF6
MDEEKLILEFLCLFQKPYIFTWGEEEIVQDACCHHKCVQIFGVQVDINELKEAKEEPASKKLKRAGNNSVAEAVRRLHNGENNIHKYDPQTSLSSPHNLEVTTYLFNGVSMAVPDVDPAVVKASCKTYFETVRRGYRMAQDENKDKMEDSRIIVRMRQRKRRLLSSRTGVLQTRGRGSYLEDYNS